MDFFREKEIEIIVFFTVITKLLFSTLTSKLFCKMSCSPECDSVPLNYVFHYKKERKKPMSTKALQRISLVLHKRFMKASARASMKSHFYRVSLDMKEGS